jgi:hypothetical protein
MAAELDVVIDSAVCLSGVDSDMPSCGSRMMFYQQIPENIFEGMGWLAVAIFLIIVGVSLVAIVAVLLMGKKY